MIEWYYVVLVTMLSVYISAWLGAEVIASNQRYKVSHIQMLLIPGLVIISAFFIGYRNNYCTVVPIGYGVKRNRRSHFLLQVSNRQIIVLEYLLYKKKLLLFLWAFNKVNRQAKSYNNTIDLQIISTVLECIEKRLLLQVRPDYTTIKVLVSTIKNDRISIPSFDYADFISCSSKNVINLARRTHEVSWNYAR